MMSLGFGDFIAGITAENLMPNTVYDVHILDCTVSYLKEGVLKRKTKAKEKGKSKSKGKGKGKDKEKGKSKKEKSKGKSESKGKGKTEGECPQSVLSLNCDSCTHTANGQFTTQVEIKICRFWELLCIFKYHFVAFNLTM